MADHELNELNLLLRIDSDDEHAALEQALLRARATELAEVRRNQVRLGAGYGDTTTRDSMTGEAAQAQLRLTMLDRLLTELRGTKPLTNRHGTFCAAPRRLTDNATHQALGQGPKTIRVAGFSQESHPCFVLPFAWLGQPRSSPSRRRLQPLASVPPALPVRRRRPSRPTLTR